MDFGLYMNIHCYQQVVDQTSEEAVLMKMLQVLLECVKGGRDGSVGLDDHHVCTAVNTCFRVVHQAGGKSELLQQFSRNAMQELVRRVFARLPLVGLEQAADVNSVKQEVLIFVTVVCFGCLVIRLKNIDLVSGYIFYLNCSCTKTGCLC
jgi:hypothetical protein